MHRSVVLKAGLFCVFLLFVTGFWVGCKPVASEKAGLEAVEIEDKENSSEGTVRIIASKSLPDKPLRVVSMAPSVTEIVFALGMGERLVGVTRYCDFPREAQALPKIGGMLDPDFEAIVAARPDLVVGVLGGADSRIGERLAAANVAYFFVQMDTVAQTYEGMVALGRALGDEAAGLAMSEKLRADLAEVQGALLAARGQAEAKRVLMVFDHEPVVAAGVNTFSYELIEMAGFRNATAGIDNPYPVLDIEKVIELNPDILIDSKVVGSGASVEAFWGQYPGLRAVQSGSVVSYDPSMLRPGPRLVEALEAIGAADKQVVQGR